MKEKPILMSAPMVRAILNGSKTQTRRLVKPQPDWIESSGRWHWPIPASKVNPGCCTSVVTASREWWEYLTTNQLPFREGLKLWVRETFCDDWRESRGIQFKADGGLDADMFDAGCKWRPSIYMPRWASRITLEVTGVRVERLQDISPADCISEGIQFNVRYGGHVADDDGRHFHCTDPRQSYFSLWEAINGEGSVQTNPWVWIIEFKRMNVSELLKFSKR